MFVDASALTAILVREDGFEVLLDGLEASSLRIVSPIVVFETVAAVARIRNVPPVEAERIVREATAELGLELRAIPTAASPLVQDAFARYGKGQGHPAQLNMGDCFSYACARHFDVPLLFKGEDFSQTDIPDALEAR